MSTGRKKKVIKNIRVDVDKCNGCLACEVICSSVHSTPRYSSSNPARSRIRVIRDALADIYVPVFAGEYTAAECAGRNIYTVDGKTYEECAFCRASCPSRGLFKEPDSGLPLKCDMCESDPDAKEPHCVTWCLADALIYEEREEEVEDTGVEISELDAGMEALADQFGWESLRDAITRLGDKG